MTRPESPGNRPRPPGPGPTSRRRPRDRAARLDGCKVGPNNAVEAGPAGRHVGGRVAGPRRRTGAGAMIDEDRPRLRLLRGRELVHDGRSYVALECPLGIFAGPILVASEWFHNVVRHFDGSNTLGRYPRSAGPRDVAAASPSSSSRSLATDLDRALALDGPALAASSTTTAASASAPRPTPGSLMPPRSTALRPQLARYFDDPEGSGPPSDAGPQRPSRVRGILSPHIDFRRGGPVYTWAYKELVERSDADVFVILGVAHSALPASVRPDPQGLRDAARPRADRPALRRPDRRARAARTCSTTSWPTAPSTRSSSRSSSSSTCSAAAATSRSCRSSSARSTT